MLKEGAENWKLFVISVSMSAIAASALQCQMSWG
jgi:hypothetical protein